MFVECVIHIGPIAGNKAFLFLKYGDIQLMETVEKEINRVTMFLEETEISI